MVKKENIEQLKYAARIAGFNHEALDRIQISFQSAGVEAHMRPVLPKATNAVYSFFHEHRCLNVGKVQCGSANRYNAHHYNGCAGSTLHVLFNYQSRLPR